MTIPCLSFCSVKTVTLTWSLIDNKVRLDLWKRDKVLKELHSLHAFCSMGHLLGYFLSEAFSKGTCFAVLAKCSTVGQLPIELQPFLCGGVGQIGPHNCLHSLTGTAVSLRPPKPVTGCCSFGKPSVRNKQAQWSNDCSTVLPLPLLGMKQNTDWAPWSLQSSNKYGIYYSWILVNVKMSFFLKRSSFYQIEAHILDVILEVLGLCLISLCG